MFPAYAGMIRDGTRTGAGVTRVPRLRGDDAGLIYEVVSTRIVFPAYAGMIR